MTDPLRQSTPEPTLAETLDRFIAAASKVHTLADRCRATALMARSADEMEIERLRAENEHLKAELAAAHRLYGEATSLIRSMEPPA